MYRVIVENSDHSERCMCTFPRLDTAREMVEWHVSHVNQERTCVVLYEDEQEIERIGPIIIQE